MPAEPLHLVSCAVSQLLVACVCDVLVNQKEAKKKPMVDKIKFPRILMGYLHNVFNL